MIIRPRPSLISLFFILKGSILSAILPRLLLVFITSCLITYAHSIYPEFFKNFSVTPFTLMGLSLSIFLGFRNNACYERWWEARKLLGQLIFELRSLARQTALVPNAEDRQRIVKRGIGFTHALVHRLRNEGDSSAEAWLPKKEWAKVHKRKNIPNAVLQALTEDLASCMRRGQISDVIYKIFATHITNISGVQAGCERILNTPLPFTYSLLVHRTAMIFCLLVPLALVDSFGWLTPVPTFMLAYAFFGLDALGDELEEPFGLTQNDLPLYAIARTVEIELLETLGETILPEPLQPVNFVLQ